MPGSRVILFPHDALQLIRDLAVKEARATLPPINQALIARFPRYGLGGLFQPGNLGGVYGEALLRQLSPSAAQTLTRWVRGAWDFLPLDPQDIFQLMSVTAAIKEMARYSKRLQRFTEGISRQEHAARTTALTILRVSQYAYEITRPQLAGEDLAYVLEQTDEGRVKKTTRSRRDTWPGPGTAPF